MARNPGITMTDIRDNPDLPWDYIGISQNPNLDIDFVLEHIGDGDTEDWNSKLISMNSGITMTDIINNPELPWNYEYMSLNPNLDIQFIREYMNEDEAWNWNWNWISRNSGITMTDIRDNPDLPWDYIGISENRNLNIEFIREHMNEEEKWDWELISLNSGITMTDIINNQDLPWKYDFVSGNPNLNIDFVKEHINEDWDWTVISTNTGITMTDIRDNIDLSWDWIEMTSNQNLDIEFVLDPEHNTKWNWSEIFRNLFFVPDPSTSTSTSRLVFSD